MAIVLREMVALASSEKCSRPLDMRDAREFIIRRGGRRHSDKE